MLSAFSVYGDKHMKKIIDVSEHQKRIDWSKVSGVDGVIIRIGYGDDEIGQDDDYVKYNLDEVERLGIPCEVYFYSYANCERQKTSEIAHIKRLIAGRNIKRVWLDLEYRPAQNYWRRMTEAFLQAFPGSGVYSWEWTFTDVLDGIDCPRWICAYGDNTGKPDYSKKPHLSCHGWQYTSRAHISGINDYVDVSEWYGDFAEAVQTPIAGRESVVGQMLALEGYSEKDGRFKAIIDGYNAYLPTAVKV
jgi:lysozyme